MRALQVPPCVRHTNFEDRMEYFKWHDIIMERGITVKVVEEFYSGMVLEYFQQHSSVMVAPDYRMKHTNLRLDLSFWLVFISLSLIPRKHKTSVNFNATTVLHDQLIDVGFFIKREIPELGCIRGLVIGAHGTTNCENGTPQVSELELGGRSLFKEQITDSRAETNGYFTDIWGNLTIMREALSLLTYPRKKKGLATFSPLSGGPVINPDAVELQAVMELSRKEMKKG
ncbi:hypothetical protein Q3G72_033761 [Acer saccharum]|nr:hypothetical protein Q3G72_033761 [Acer saccharum]